MTPVVDHSAAIEEQSRALWAAAAAAGPDAPVPTCPKWTVRNLVRHIASAHVLALGALETPWGGRLPSNEPPPEDWDALPSWWAERRGALLTALRTADPERSCWAFPGGPAGNAGFWARRQAHETAIHRLDAEHAAGRGDTVEFPVDLAADGVDEFLVRLVPTIRALHDASGFPAGTTRWVATDAARAWRTSQADDGYTATADPTDPAADVTVTGPAGALYRYAWGRPTTAVTTTGDDSLLSALRPI